MSAHRRDNKLLNRRGTWLAVILLVTVLLRFAWLNHWSLWTDELYTWRLVQNLRIVREGVPDDQHPPLYYLLLAAWQRPGSGEAWLRLPSALAGAAAVPAMLGAGILLRGRRFGLYVAALTATSPLLVWYAREMRMYGLATLFWSLALFFYTLLLVRGRWWAALGLAAANLLGLYTAYPTLGLLGLEAALAVPLWVWRGQRRWRRLIYLALALLLTGAGFMPWLPQFAQQIGREGYNFNWPIPWDATRHFQTNMQQTLSAAAVVGVAGALALWLLFLVVWRRPAWRRRLRVWAGPVAAMLALGFVLFFLLGAYPRGLTLRRQILVFWPPVLLLGAWALDAWRGRTAVVGVALLGFLASGTFLLGPAYEDWRGAAAHLQAHAAADEPVFFGPTWARMSVEYYDRQPVNVVVGQPEAADPPLEAGETVWYVVNQHPRQRDQTAAAETWLRRHGTLVSEARFARFIAVLEFQMR